jgi:hypothetical protein
MVYTTGPCCLGPVEETHPHRWLHTSGLDILCHSARLELALLEHKNQQSVIYWNWNKFKMLLHNFVLDIQE